MWGLYILNILVLIYSSVIHWYWYCYLLFLKLSSVFSLVYSCSMACGKQPQNKILLFITVLPTVIVWAYLLPFLSPLQLPCFSFLSLPHTPLTGYIISSVISTIFINNLVCQQFTTPVAFSPPHCIFCIFCPYNEKLHSVGSKQEKVEIGDQSTTIILNSATPSWFVTIHWSFHPQISHLNVVNYTITVDFDDPGCKILPNTNFFLFPPKSKITSFFLKLKLYPFVLLIDVFPQVLILVEKKHTPSTIKRTKVWETVSQYALMGVSGFSRIWSCL